MQITNFINSIRSIITIRKSHSIQIKRYSKPCDHLKQKKKMIYFKISEFQVKHFVI